MLLHLQNLWISCKPLLITLVSLSLVKVNLLAATVGLIVSIGYTLRRWYLLEKNEKEKAAAKVEKRNSENES